MPKPAWYQAIGKYAYSNLNKSLWQIIDIRSVLRPVGPDALHGSTGVSLLGHSGVGCGGRRHPGPRFHPFPRLLSRLLLCVTPGKHNPRLRRRFNIHTVRRLEVRPQYTSCHAGDVGRQGVGDIWTMTKEEYLAAPRRKRSPTGSIEIPSSCRAGSGAAVFIFPAIF